VIDGGYDVGYRVCDCFWGKEPGRLVSNHIRNMGDLKNLRVLDAGCGEGKNAQVFSSLGATVTAVDCSDEAINNGKRAWPDLSIEWVVSDIRDFKPNPQAYDIVISYGLYHCLKNKLEIHTVAHRLMSATRIGGYNIVCTFNDRHQDLSAHPDFSPCLLPHNMYAEIYKEWKIDELSDEDLFETHPHNQIPHTHSLTRLIARRKT